jgi:hypothetical protein
MFLHMFYTTITYHTTYFVMDWTLMSATQAAGIGDLVNTEAMAEIIHRTAVRVPQHLVSRSDKSGPGLLKVAQKTRKEGA